MSSSVPINESAGVWEEYASRKGVVPFSDVSVLAEELTENPLRVTTLVPIGWKLHRLLTPELLAKRFASTRASHLLHGLSAVSDAVEYRISITGISLLRMLFEDKENHGNEKSPDGLRTPTVSDHHIFARIDLGDMRAVAIAALSTLSSRAADFPGREFYTLKELPDSFGYGCSDKLAPSLVKDIVDSYWELIDKDSCMISDTRPGGVDYTCSLLFAEQHVFAHDFACDEQQTALASYSLGILSVICHESKYADKGRRVLTKIVQRLAVRSEDAPVYITSNSYTDRNESRRACRTALEKCLRSLSKKVSKHEMYATDVCYLINLLFVEIALGWDIADTLARVSAKDPEEEPGRTEDPEEESGRTEDPEEELGPAEDPEEELGRTEDPEEEANASYRAILAYLDSFRTTENIEESVYGQEPTDTRGCPDAVLQLAHNVLRIGNHGWCLMRGELSYATYDSQKTYLNSNTIHLVDPFVSEEEFIESQTFGIDSVTTRADNTVVMSPQAAMTAATSIEYITDKALEDPNAGVKIDMCFKMGLGIALPGIDPEYVREMIKNNPVNGFVLTFRDISLRVRPSDFGSNTNMWCCEVVSLDPKEKTGIPDVFTRDAASTQLRQCYECVKQTHGGEYVLYGGLCGNTTVNDNYKFGDLDELPRMLTDLSVNILKNSKEDCVEFTYIDRVLHGDTGITATGGLAECVESGAIFEYIANNKDAKSIFTVLAGYFHMLHTEIPDYLYIDDLDYEIKNHIKYYLMTEEEGAEYTLAVKACANACVHEPDVTRIKSTNVLKYFQKRIVTKFVERMYKPINWWKSRQVQSSAAPSVSSPNKNTHWYGLEVDPSYVRGTWKNIKPKAEEPDGCVYEMKSEVCGLCLLVIKPGKSNTIGLPCGHQFCWSNRYTDGVLECGGYMTWHNSQISKKSTSKLKESPGDYGSTCPICRAISIAKDPSKNRTKRKASCSNFREVVHGNLSWMRAI
jgi:hypothetical protein